MRTSRPTRRQFLQTTTLASLGASSARGYASISEDHSAAHTALMRSPDSISACYSDSVVRPMQSQKSSWTSPGCRLDVDVHRVQEGQAVSVTLEASAVGLVRLRMRWSGPNTEDALLLGDHWERAYGDLEWRGIQPERVMPWYCIVRSKDGTSGYGVETGAAAFCFWQVDSSGVTLTIDLKNGGGAADLRGRRLALCTVIQRSFPPEVPFHEAMHAFCGHMCSAPRLPRTPLFGVNDWNYAYGRNTAEGILRDADLLASLAPAVSAKPYVVIDDGWQDPQRFPSMPALAAQIGNRGLEPGLWIRPLRAPAQTNPGLLLPARRFGEHATDAAPAFDPTSSEALLMVLETISEPVKWGYVLLKHDFSTWELFGRWGFQMGAQLTAPGWNFQNPRLTNAEVVTGLYRQIRAAAGASTVILGCNTVGHLAAGLFESQRIGDDTSGKDWERTRRMGVNALAQRLGQHGTFSHIDPDIVAITPNIGWRETAAWMDVVARTGASLFVAPDPTAMTPGARAAMKDAMAVVVQQKGAYPVQPTQSTTPELWREDRSGASTTRYQWTPEGSSSSTLV